MPWKECQIVEERLRFIARLLDGEKMAGLCREFGISRKTGYKIYRRYCGASSQLPGTCVKGAAAVDSVLKGDQLFLS